jgi:hypothetical protein
MNGGTISDNRASSGSGGGVYVLSGTFTMNNGNIINNRALGEPSYGGGVYISSGTFTMNGGSISGNSTIASFSSGSSSEFLISAKSKRKNLF